MAIKYVWGSSAAFTHRGLLIRLVELPNYKNVDDGLLQWRTSNSNIYNMNTVTHCTLGMWSGVHNIFCIAFIINMGL